MKIFGLELKFNGFDIWHKGNMGTGSGLDADTIDTKHASDFATAAQGTKADNALPATSNAVSATKLATARSINGVSFDGQGNIMIPSLYDANYRRITNPGGAEYVTNTTTITGAIAIGLPIGMTNTMVRMTIKIYEYVTNESFEVHCGGYTYSGGNTWANNPYAYILGNPNIDRRFTVRFGYTAGGKAVIYIGELASTWSYPQVFVTEVLCGYGGMSASWTTGWSVGFQASAFENVTATISGCQVGYAVSTNTANSGVLRDASGNFSAGTITATLNGNATNADTIDTLHATSFMRADADTATTGTTLTVGSSNGANSTIQIGTGSATGTLSLKFRTAGTEGWLQYVQGAGTGFLFKNSSGTWMPVQANNFVSNVATGTPPLTVASTTEVANLRAATAGNADTIGNKNPNYFIAMSIALG